jgi:Cytochrome P460
MVRLSFLLVVASLVFALSAQPPQKKQATAPVVNTPQYTPDGMLKMPTNYREWIYLSTGIDMSYRFNPGMEHSMFDNVFVNPESYRAFLETGTWPDKTMMVLEVRGAASKSAINKAGHYQTQEIMGVEVHVKDEVRFGETGKWAFFSFDDETASKMIPKEMDCYSCHQQHAAVDTTFVQFYPTLIELAKKKGTLSPSYVKDEAAAAAAMK